MKAWLVVRWPEWSRNGIADMNNLSDWACTVGPAASILASAPLVDASPASPSSLISASEGDALDAAVTDYDARVPHPADAISDAVSSEPLVAGAVPTLASPVAAPPASATLVLGSLAAPAASATLVLGTLTSATKASACFDDEAQMCPNAPSPVDRAASAAPRDFEAPLARGAASSGAAPHTPPSSTRLRAVSFAGAKHTPDSSHSKSLKRPRAGNGHAPSSVAFASSIHRDVCAETAPLFNSPSSRAGPEYTSDGGEAPLDVVPAAAAAATTAVLVLPRPSITFDDDSSSYDVVFSHPHGGSMQVPRADSVYDAPIMSSDGAHSQRASQHAPPLHENSSLGGAIGVCSAALDILQHPGGVFINPHFPAEQSEGLEAAAAAALGAPIITLGLPHADAAGWVAPQRWSLAHHGPGLAPGELHGAVPPAELERRRRIAEKAQLFELSADVERANAEPPDPDRARVARIAMMRSLIAEAEELLARLRPRRRRNSGVVSDVITERANREGASEMNDVLEHDVLDTGGASLAIANAFNDDDNVESHGLVLSASQRPGAIRGRAYVRSPAAASARATPPALAHVAAAGGAYQGSQPPVAMASFTFDESYAPQQYDAHSLQLQCDAAAPERQRPFPPAPVGPEQRVRGRPPSEQGIQPPIHEAQGVAVAAGASRTLSGVRRRESAVTSVGAVTRDTMRSLAEPMSSHAAARRDMRQGTYESDELGDATGAFSYDAHEKPPAVMSRWEVQRQQRHEPAAARAPHRPKLVGWGGELTQSSTLTPHHGGAREGSAAAPRYSEERDDDRGVDPMLRRPRVRAGEADQLPVAPARVIEGRRAAHSPPRRSGYVAAPTYAVSSAALSGRRVPGLRDPTDDRTVTFAEHHTGTSRRHVDDAPRPGILAGLGRPQSAPLGAAPVSASLGGAAHAGHGGGHFSSAHGPAMGGAKLPLPQQPPPPAAAGSRFNSAAHRSGEEGDVGDWIDPRGRAAAAVPAPPPPLQRTPGAATLGAKQGAAFASGAPRAPVAGTPSLARPPASLGSGAHPHPQPASAASVQRRGTSLKAAPPAVAPKPPPSAVPQAFATHPLPPAFAPKQRQASLAHFGVGVRM